ncbi:hypothetical protein ACQ7B2_24360, partial [Escherichia coli]
LLSKQGGNPAMVDRVGLIQRQANGLLPRGRRVGADDRLEGCTPLLGGRDGLIPVLEAAHEVA